ncbi:MAG: alpha/beta hydrolase [Ornithinimicrobium sp.]
MSTHNAAKGMELDYATIDGRRIRFAASRQPGAPQVILTSPQPMSVLTYSDWWDELRERFDVVAVDLPNHGGSDADRSLTTVSQQAAFLPEILDHFDLVHPHYVGPDVGTPIAVRFMADNPGRLRSAVIGDAGAVGHVEGALLFRLLVNSRLTRLLSLSAGGAIGGRIYCAAANSVGYKRRQKPDKARLADYRRGSTTFAKLRGQSGFLASYPDETPALEQVAPTIETPVLVLHGERDTFVGIGNSRRLADALPHSDFHVVPEAGHYAWEDNPEPYLAQVLRWIDLAEANS